MSWLVIVIMAIVLLVIVIIKLSTNRSADSVNHPYRKLDSLFTPAERSFLGVLLQAVGKDTQVFGKVRVADVLNPKKGMSRSDWQKAFNKISSKHFDFLLCAKKDLAVLCVIELNDSSHNSKKTKNRDDFLNGACKAAQVPLIQIPAQRTYSIIEIRKSLESFIPREQPESLPLSRQSITGNRATQSKLCPKCSSDMVKRVAKKGKNIGSEFWACSSFPKCRHIESIND